VYRFKVTAINFNGEGPESTEVRIQTCSPPSDLLSPVYVTSTQTTITLSWREPMMLNNCSLQGFKLFRDDGAGSLINIETNPLLNTSPTSLEDTVTFTSGDLGKEYRFQVQAITLSGLTITSGITFVTLADVPETPLTGPTNIHEDTNENQIGVQYATPLPSSRGGSILEINLQMSNGSGYYDV
jgi:hypothetical protein